MKFYKWPKTASLLDLESKDPRLFEAASKVDGWTATEKIDGANFSIAVNKEEVRYASRNQLLNPCDNFFDLHSHLAQIEPIVNAAKETVLEGDLDQLVIYGEYFGEDVMNRIPYKTKGDFRFYSMLTAKDGNLFYFSFGELAYFFTKHGLGKFLVPIIDTFPTLEDAMKLSPEFSSLINPEAMAEGFVILPVAKLPCSAPAAPFSDCISTTLTFEPNKLRFLIVISCFSLSIFTKHPIENSFPLLFLYFSW